MGRKKRPGQRRELGVDEETERSEKEEENAGRIGKTFSSSLGCVE
jgi:hypothetical protein